MARYVTFYGISIIHGEKQLGYNNWSVIEFSDTRVVGIDYNTIAHFPLSDYATVEEALKKNNKWIEISVDLAKCLMQLPRAVKGSDADNMYKKYTVCNTTVPTSADRCMTLFLGGCLGYSNCAAMVLRGSKYYKVSYAGEYEPDPYYTLDFKDYLGEGVVEIDTSIVNALVANKGPISAPLSNKLYDAYKKVAQTSSDTPEEYLPLQTSEQNYRERQAKIFRDIFS